MRAAVLFVAALAGAALTASLGLWQLDRAAQKLALQASLQAQGELPPVGGPALQGGVATVLLQRRAVLRGEWLDERTVYLDNRPMDGRTGLFVVTPLRLADGGGTLLVQRGWLPRDAGDRSRIAPFKTDGGLVTVQGRLAATPSRLYQLGEPAGGPIRQNLDPALFAIEIGERLLPFTLVQTVASEPGDGLLRHWPAPDLGLQKHYGYAFQWFALCALILGLYVWFQLLRPRLRPRLRART